MSELVQIPKDELFHIPNNCWAFDAVTKQLITERTIPRIREIVLVPKAAGG